MKIIARTKNGRDVAAWLLKANPDVWDLAGETDKYGHVDGWTGSKTRTGST